MKYLRDILIGLVVAAALILYHNAYPIVRIHYSDERTISLCAPPAEAGPPSPWQQGRI